MARQYDNIEKYLKKGGFKILDTKEDYIKNKELYKFSTRFNYQCNNNHIKDITIASFINKKSKIKNNYVELCADCVKIEENKKKLQELQEEIKETCHKVLSYNNNKDVIYECGNCKSINHTYSQNLLKASKYCSKCQNIKNRLSFDDVKKRVENKGMKLLDCVYENNKQLLPIICVCGREYKLVLHDIERGRQCIFCKNGKNEEICRKIFQKLTGKKFENQRPKWLDGLELDGYEEELKIGWEYNGKQHYMYVPEFFHSKGIEEFHSQQERDKKKIELCKKKGIKLLIIHYSYSKDLHKLEDYIKQFLKN
jgi:hypothetical protein